MLNLALISASYSKYSESFIQSHRQGIKENIFYYYGGLIPHYLDGEGLITVSRSLKFRVLFGQLLRFNLVGFLKSKLSIDEYMLARSFKRHKIDVVLAEFGTTAASILDVCRYAGIPLVAHFHGYDCSVYTILEEYKDKYKELFQYCPYIIAVSHKMISVLKELGCPEDKLVYVPCVPEEQFYEIVPRFSSKQFFFVGRFIDKKAPYVLLLAFKKVLDKYPEAKLVMAGDGPLLPACRNLSRLLLIDNKVLFPGIISKDESIKYLEESQAYVQHSITAEDGDMEGTPVSVMEASAAGLPVISTFHAGIPEIIVNNKTGLLCGELDVMAMAENMMKVLENKDFAISLGKSGKERMLKSFSKQKQMEVLTEVIEKAANKVLHNE